MKAITDCAETIRGWFSSSEASRKPLPGREDETFFTDRAAAHMIIGRECDIPFDNPSFLFEPAFGGLRAFAYLAPGECALVGKHGLRLQPWFPEFAGLHKQVADRCVLDGEIVFFKNGCIEASACAKRLSLTDKTTVTNAAREERALFVANDVVFSEKRLVTDQPLIDRKELLDTIVKEGKILTAARFLQGHGTMLCASARRKNLEGVVAKHKTSRYHFGAKSPDWVAVKKFLYDNFIICGHADTDDGPRLLLGQYDPTGVIIYRGTAPLPPFTEGVEKEYVRIVGQKQAASHPFAQLAPELRPEQHTGVTWFVPTLVCSISFSARDEHGALENPVYRCLRPDKTWEDTVISDPGGYYTAPDMGDWALGPGSTA
ncbi:MAG: DNA ligase [Desulfovibrio sp.]